tara:strand:+ start:268 stop:441 length:174 start_codon:yes stop_codon:yes gene_type:complete
MPTPSKRKNEILLEVSNSIKEKEAQAKFKYKDPKTGEIYEYERRGIYKKDGRTLIPE